MSRRTPGRPARSLLIPIVLTISVLLVAGCASDPKDAGKKKASTTTSTPYVDPNVTTTRPAIDPADIVGGKPAYVKAMVAMISQSTGLEGDDATKASECLAPKWVDIIGVAGFAKAGVRPEDFATMGGGLEQLGLTRTQAEKMVAGFDQCKIDLRAATLGQMSSQSGMSDEIAACLDKAITKELVEQGLVASLIGEENDASAALREIPR